MSREPETQETFDDSFQIGDRDAAGIALEIEETMGPVRRAAGDFVRSLFMKHGYFNGRAESFVDHEDDWITCRVVVSCYGLPNNSPRPRTIWTVKPVDGVTLNVGDILAPMKEFPDNNRLIRCRRQGEYPVWCHIEGDGAAELMKYPLPLPWLEITEVSEISGFGKAVLRGCSR